MEVSNLEYEEEDFREEVQRYLMESGDRELLITVMREKLYSSGWKENVTKCCKDLIFELGVDNVTMDVLFEKIAPKAREMVPLDIKRDMLDMIQNILETRFNVR